MSGRRIAWVLVAAAFVGLIGFRVYEAVSGSRTSATGGVAPGAGRNQAASVRVEPVRRGSVQSVVIFSGSLQPEYELDVVSRMAGRLAAVHVEPGQRVEAGQVLATFEDEDLRLQEKQAEARLQGSRIALRQAETRLERARSEYQRVLTLRQRGAATQQELDNAWNQLQMAEIDYEAAQAQLAQAEADFGLLQLQLERIHVDAPVAGVITEVPAVAGSQVSNFGLIARLAAMDPMEVVFHVPEREIARVRVGQTLQVTTDAYPGEVFTGEVHSLGASVDARTRTLEVKGRVANPDLRLRPGMFARVELVTAQREDVLTVPREAVVLRSDGPHVFVVEDGRARLRRVVTGVEGRERVEITAGLSEGTPVITVGQQNLRDGQAVRLVEAGDRGAASGGNESGSGRPGSGESGAGGAAR